MTIRRDAGLALAACLGVLLCAGRIGAVEIRVSAASSLTEAIQDASAAWTSKSGDGVVLNFGASSLLARQIAEGAPADLFLSADEARMDDLAAKNLIDPKTRKILLSNALALVVARDRGAAVASPEDLLRPGVRTIALGETRSVPAGVYAREYLVRKGLWDRVASKVVPTENVRAALAAVESGDADAAIVYRTDALVAKNVRVVFEVPAAEGPRISYPGAVTTGAKNPDRARRFLEFLASPAGFAIFRRYGFLVSQ